MLCRNERPSKSRRAAKQERRSHSILDMAAKMNCVTCCLEPASLGCLQGFVEPRRRTGAQQVNFKVNWRIGPLSILRCCDRLGLEIQACEVGFVCYCTTIRHRVTIYISVHSRDLSDVRSVITDLFSMERDYSGTVYWLHKIALYHPESQNPDWESSHPSHQTPVWDSFSGNRVCD